MIYLYIIVILLLGTCCFVYSSMQELATGEPVLVDLNEESDNQEQDFDVWESDAVDVDRSTIPSHCMLICHV